MPTRGPSTIRFCVTAGVLLGAFVLLQTMSHGEATVARRPLRNLPYTGALDGAKRTIAVGRTSGSGRYGLCEPVLLWRVERASSALRGVLRQPENGRYDPLAEELTSGRGVGSHPVRIRDNPASERALVSFTKSYFRY
jgi:hypothetical protein